MISDATSPSAPLDVLASSLADALQATWPRWLDSHSPLRRNVELPDAELLRNILAVILRASFQREESRSVRFRLQLCTRENVSDAITNSDYIPSFPRYAAFEPCPLTVNEITRLAPATDPGEAAMAVSSSGTGPELWGMIQAGLDGRQYTREMPDGLTIEVSEPGSIRFGRRGHVFLELRRGEVFRLTPSVLVKGPVAVAFDVAIHELHRQLELSFRRPVEIEAAEDSYLKALRNLLNGVEEFGHGGTVIIVPHVQRAGETFPLTFKYQLSWSRLWDLLVGSAQQAERLSAVSPHSLFGPRDITAGELFSMLTLGARMTDALQDTLSVVRRFTQVDGALVLTDRFEVLGFGAQLNAPGIDEIRVACDAEMKALTKQRATWRGMRHRSCYAFCAAVEGAVGFVFSQDGGIQAVRNANGHVTVWPDIDTDVLCLNSHDYRLHT